jgi:cytochrome P450
MRVMRDPTTFTVDDPRFSTGQVVGSSMLTLDGEEHRRHREPFARPFRLAAVRARFTELVAQETERLIDAIEPAGRAELRASLTGPLAVAVVTSALGLEDADAGAVLGWYHRIVAAVTDITAGRPLTATGREAAARRNDSHKWGEPTPRGASPQGPRGRRRVWRAPCPGRRGSATLTCDGAPRSSSAQGP